MRALRTSLERTEARLAALDRVERKVDALQLEVDLFDTSEISELGEAFAALEANYNRFRTSTASDLNQVERSVNGVQSEIRRIRDGLGNQIEREVVSSLRDIGSLTVNGSFTVKNRDGEELFSIGNSSSGHGAILRVFGASGKETLYAGPSTDGTTLFRVYGKDGSRYLNLAEDKLRLEDGRGNDLLYIGPSDQGRMLFRIHEKRGGELFLNIWEDRRGGGGLDLATRAGEVSLGTSTSGASLCVP